MRRTLLVLATSLTTLTTVAAVPSAAATPTPDQVMAARLQSRVASMGLSGALAGQVVDVGSGKLVWGHRNTTLVAPASTTKLVTAANALATYGPDHRFTTVVRRGATSASIAVVGAGDPSLSGADLSALAATTAARLRAVGRSRVSLVVDDSLFVAPTRATGWQVADVPAEVSPVRALVVDERRSLDTSLDAGRVLAAKLKAQGITVTAVVRGRSSTAYPELARVAGDPMRDIVTRMMLRSDNDHAEALHRLVALRVRGGTSWRTAMWAQREVLARTTGVWLVPDQLDDGSGLSRTGRLTAAQLSRVVASVMDPRKTKLAVLRGQALPLAGRTGTLRASLYRFTSPASRCAAGQLRAKTGTLDQTVALSGWAVGADGRLKSFAFVINGRGDSLALKQRLDALAATVDGCY